MHRIIAMAAMGALLSTLAGAQVPQELKQREFMRRKLDHSQRALEGLVIEDFKLIEQNAGMLSKLSLVAEFQIFPSPEYRQYSEEFRRAADAMARLAKQENIDGATLKYVELTLTCVNCHKYVRGLRLAEGPKIP